MVRAAHRNRTIRFVRYGYTGKIPVPSSSQTCKLTAVIITAVNRIDTVIFSRITASYGYTGARSALSSFWVQYRTEHMKNGGKNLMNLVAKL